MRVAVLVAVTAVAASCGGGAATISRADARAGDAFELRATVGGSFAKLLGSSHEWYAPRSGAFESDHPTPRERIVEVYDGQTITRRARGGIIRVSGAARMLRQLTAYPNILVTPGVTVVQAYLGLIDTKGTIHVRRTHGGRVLLANWHYETDTGDEHVPIRVEIVRRGDHDFEPLHGKLVGAFRQSPPGTPPHFGLAYWFGPTLGAARAKTLLERWGLDWERFPPERQVTQYQTVYRLPPAALPREIANEGRSNYPGLGEKPPSEVWVTCEPRVRGFLPAVGQGTRPKPLRLATGERAQLYSGGFVLRGREGVTSVIVVRGTVCIVDGLIPPQQFRALARTLHRPR